VWAFFATGMLLNIVAALELQEMLSSPTAVSAATAGASLLMIDIQRGRPGRGR
jgi:hypothetical protein